jgi:hypothetical protein
MIGTFSNHFSVQHVAHSQATSMHTTERKLRNSGDEIGTAFMEKYNRVSVVNVLQGQHSAVLALSCAHMLGGPERATALDARSKLAKTS